MKKLKTIIAPAFMAAVLGSANVAQAETPAPAQPAQKDQPARLVLPSAALGWRSNAFPVTGPDAGKDAKVAFSRNAPVPHAKYGVPRAFDEPQDDNRWRQAFRATEKDKWMRIRHFKPEITIPGNWNRETTRVTLRAKHGGFMLQVKIKTR